MENAIKKAIGLHTIWFMGITIKREGRFLCSRPAVRVGVARIEFEEGRIGFGICAGMSMECGGRHQTPRSDGHGQG